jgi:hypothetical protein
MSYIRGHRCDIVLNVHASVKDKVDDINDRFYEELEDVFNKFSMYHLDILLGDFNAEVGRDDAYILIPTIRNESVHEINNDNGIGQIDHIMIARALTCT